MRESKFWDYVRKGMHGKWLARRIENCAGPGDPDINYAFSREKQGNIELKFIEKSPKRASTLIKLPYFKPEQRLFMRVWGPVSGNIWLFVKIEDEYFLWDWRGALMADTKTLDEWRRDSIRVWKGRVDWEELKKALLTGC